MNDLPGEFNQLIQEFGWTFPIWVGVYIAMWIIGVLIGSYSIGVF